MAIPNIKYAIYPGSVTLYDGTTETFTAEELAELYGVEDEDYLVIPDETPPWWRNYYLALLLVPTIREVVLAVLSTETYLEYIHLKPRADGTYQNIKQVAQDDGEIITYGEDFDGDKTYVQETDRRAYDLEFLDRY